MLAVVFAFTALSVDVGYVAVTRARLQAASDAGALAAALELPDGLGIAPEHTPSETESACGEAAVFVIGRHRAGELDSVFLSKSRDPEYGQVVWDTTTNDWKKTWGKPPYNLVAATVRRDQSPADADGPLRLFFAPLVGHREANLVLDSQAAVLPANGFRIRPGSTLKAGVLPVTLDYDTWLDYAKAVRGLPHSGHYSDRYTYHESTGNVAPGSDGVPEVCVCPHGSKALPPGNRGTVGFGHTGDSVEEVRRQILEGLDQSDLSYFPDGKITASFANPLVVKGYTGVSDDLENQLAAVEGQPRALPVFTTTSGDGDGAYYTIVKFVGVRVVHVELKGHPPEVLIQPASLMDSTAVRDTTGSATVEDGVFTRPVLVE